MLAKVISCALVGLEGALVEVEVDIAPGLPNFFVVGLPDDAVREARERARAAVKNSGFTFPMRRIVVNLAPADLKKEGPAYDLPIAVGVLAAAEQIPPESLEGAMVIVVNQPVPDRSRPTFLKPFFWANCRWTVRFGIRAASSRWSRSPARWVFRMLWCLRSMPGKPLWSGASVSSPFLR